jgi:hypothetical protein
MSGHHRLPAQFRFLLSRLLLAGAQLAGQRSKVRCLLRGLYLAGANYRVVSVRAVILARGIDRWVRVIGGWGA